MRISDWSSDVCSSDLDRISRRYHIRNISEIALDEVPDDSRTPKAANGQATAVTLCRRVRSAGPAGPDRKGYWQIDEGGSPASAGSQLAGRRQNRLVIRADHQGRDCKTGV